MAHNITLEPGEMLLFESHSSIHGHPFPLKGRYAAYIFIHFEPTGHALGKNESGYFYVKDDADENQRRLGRPSKAQSQKASQRKADKDYRKNVADGHGGPSSSFKGELPPYIQRKYKDQSFLVIDCTHRRKRCPILIC